MFAGGIEPLSTISENSASGNYAMIFILRAPFRSQVFDIFIWLNERRLLPFHFSVFNFPFSISTGGNVGNKFSIDMHTGELTARPLDRETHSRYFLQITAQDRGTPVTYQGQCNISVIGKLCIPARITRVSLQITTRFSPQLKIRTIMIPALRWQSMWRR